MPQTIDDILSRRFRALLLNARASLEMAPIVASVMAEEYGYDSDWQNSQLVDYFAVSENYLISELHSA